MYETTFHEDGTITYWSVHKQQWVRRTTRISTQDLAAMSSEEADQVIAHLGLESR